MPPAPNTHSDITMVEYAKRPEVTVQTMGKVHNPSGEGIRAVSSKVQSKAMKLKQQQEPQVLQANSNTANGNKAKSNAHHPHHNSTIPEHETKIKEEGSARRNIIRKKSTAAEGKYDSRNKKQGGHGKGQWSNETQISMEEYYYNEDFHHEELDVNDPLYDETKDPSRFILTSGGGDLAKEGEEPVAKVYYENHNKGIYGPLLTLPEFKIRLAESLREYFDSADAEEVIRSILEMKCRAYHPEVVKKAISLSLDEGPRERELTSRLLTCLHPTPLSSHDMEAGFKVLLDSLDDLEIDIPDAKTMVASFLARAVVDEVLSPAFLSNCNNDRPGDVVIEKAVSLLTREHSTARLERVWGPGDGRAVPELKAALDQLLQEYLMSRELDEAARCVRELKAPHFHHELVKRGVTHAMEERHDPKASLDAMVALLSFLVENAIVSEYQVAKGVNRLHNLLPDLQLDIPAAQTLLEEFEEMANERGCLPQEKGEEEQGQAVSFETEKSVSEPAVA